MVEGISELREGVLLGERYLLVRRAEVFSVGAERVAGVEYEYWVALDESTRAEVWIQFAAAGGAYADGAALAGAVAALRRINHPAVPAVHAFGEYEFERGGELLTVGYCAIPAVEAETLAAALVRETLDRAEILLALGQVAEVLQLIGEFELVHGHLSAHSVLLAATADTGYDVVLADLPASLALETATESDLTAAADVYALAWLTVLALIGPAVLEAEFGAGFAATLEFDLEAMQVVEHRQAWAAENLEVLGVSAGLVAVLLRALGEASGRPRVTALASAIRGAWVEIQQQAAAGETAAMAGAVAAVGIAEAVEAAELVDVVEAAEVAEAAEAVEFAEAVEAVEIAEAVEAAEVVAAAEIVEVEETSGERGTRSGSRKQAAKKDSAKKKAAETAAVVGAAGVVGLVAAESASAAAGTAAENVAASGNAAGSVAGNAASAGNVAAGNVAANSGIAGGAAGTVAAGGGAAGTASVEEVFSAQESAGAVTELIPIVGGGRKQGTSPSGRQTRPTSPTRPSTPTRPATPARPPAHTRAATQSGPAGSSGGNSHAARRRPLRGAYIGAGAGAGVAVVIIILVIVLTQGSSPKSNNTAVNTSNTTTATGPASAAASPSTAASTASTAGTAGSTETAGSGSNSGGTTTGTSTPAAAGGGATSPTESVTFPATLETYPATPAQALQQIQQAVTKAQSELSPTEVAQLGQITTTLQQEINSHQSLSTGTAQLWGLLHSGELPSSFNNYLEELASFLSASGGS